jgi:hypothetical protein
MSEILQPLNQFTAGSITAGSQQNATPIPKKSCHAIPKKYWTRNQRRYS